MRYFSISQLSEAVGLDRATIRKKLAGLTPYKKSVNSVLYDGHEAFQLLYKQENQTDIDKQLLNEQLRYEQARANKLVIEVEEMRKEVVPIEDVGRVVEKEYSRVRSQFIAIPTKLAKDLSILADPRLIKEALEDAINECLSELSADEKYLNQETPKIEEDNAGDIT